MARAQRVEDLHPDVLRQRRLEDLDAQRRHPGPRVEAPRVGVHLLDDGRAVLALHAADVVALGRAEARHRRRRFHRRGHDRGVLVVVVVRHADQKKHKFSTECTRWVREAF